MQRRELLKSLLALPMMKQVSVNGKTASSTVSIPAGHYMVFVDRRAINIETLINSPCPEGVTMDIIPMYLKAGQTIEDAVKIYRVKGAPDGNESLDVPRKKEHEGQGHGR